MYINTIKHIIVRRWRNIRKYITTKQMFFVLFILFILLNGILLFDNFQNRMPIFGLRFEGNPISFYKPAKLQKLITSYAQVTRKPIELTYGDKHFSIDPSDVGYQIDPAYEMNKILLIGREGNIFQKLFTQTKAMLGFENIHLTPDISQSLLTMQVVEIQEAINHEPIPMHPDFSHSMEHIIPSEPGVQVDTSQLASIITTSIAHSTNKTFSIPVHIIQPHKYSEQDMQVLREEAIQRTQTGITVSSAGQLFTLTPTDLKELLTVVERPDTVIPKKTTLSLRLDNTRLNKKLGDFAEKVEAITHAEFDDHDAIAIIYGQFYSDNRHVAAIPTGQIAGLYTSRHVLGAQSNNEKKNVYLTIDDGPNAIYHPLILDILKKYHVKATFFLIGQNVLVSKDIAINTYKDGHVVGNHSLTHSFMPNFSSNFIANELSTTNEILESINGNKPITYFRPPYGGLNATILQDAHTVGLHVFLWDVDPRDWSEPPVDELVNRVISKTHDGSTILLHSNHLVTVRALPKILETLLAENYTFKTLDEYPQNEQL